MTFDNSLEQAGLPCNSKYFSSPLWGNWSQHKHAAIDPTGLLTLPAQRFLSLLKTGQVSSSCRCCMLMRCVRNAEVPCAYAHRIANSMRLQGRLCVSGCSFKHTCLPSCESEPTEMSIPAVLEASDYRGDQICLSIPVGSI
jgi:hypothetical protein